MLVAWHNANGNGPLRAPQAFAASKSWVTGLCFTGAPSGFCGGNNVGLGGLVLLAAPDGMWDGFNEIQGARTYDPELGGWTSPDADGGVVDAPITQKPYAWNGNNPLSNSDPTGLNFIFEGGSGYDTLDVKGRGPHGPKNFSLIPRPFGSKEMSQAARTCPCKYVDPTSLRTLSYWAKGYWNDWKGLPASEKIETGSAAVIAAAVVVALADESAASWLATRTIALRISLSTRAVADVAIATGVLSGTSARYGTMTPAGWTVLYGLTTGPVAWYVIDSVDAWEHLGLH